MKRNLNGYWSKESVIEEIRERHRMGMSLSSTVVQKEHSNLYSNAREQFGNWRNAIDAAGVEFTVHRGRKRSSEISP